MRAALIHALDGPGSVRVGDVVDPVPESGEVLIRVRAVGLTFPEVLQTRGLYQLKPELPFVPGSQVAGEVIEAPPGSALVPGDRVAAFTYLGGLAELATAEVTSTFFLPAGIDFDQACAIPLNYFTAHVALKHRGRLSPGESVLIHGAAGGVGSAAVQVAKALGAGRVVGVVSSEAKGEVALEAGADEWVAVTGFRDAVTATGKVDIVFDPVGGDRFSDSLRCLDTEGRLLVVGFTAGEIPTVKVNRLLLNNLDVIGVSWGGIARSRPGFMQAQWDELMGFALAGTVRPLVAATVPLDQVVEGLELIDQRAALGTVVVNP